MADSFYGGKPGRDFIIKDRFGSIEDMIKAFQLGPEYTNVWFDEVVIIDTYNKNDLDNGKVYRRGFDYTNNMGGALYVGQIVGPRSGTPYMHMVTLDEAKEHSTETLGEFEYRQYPTGMGEDGHYKYSTDPGEEGKPIDIFEFSTDHDASLVPGKKDDGSFNDAIRWTWVNIRKDDDEAGTVVYVGWEIPYLVMEYEEHTVSQYDENGDFINHSSTVDRVDEKDHPYYEKWDFGIPKGIKGDALRNLRVMIPTEEDRDKLYAVSAMSIQEDGTVTVGAPGYEGIDDDIEFSRAILVYDLYYFDHKLNPEPVTFFLGDWNKIDGVQLDDDGTLTIEYSHDDNTVFSRKIKWITDVTLAPDTGVFEVHYNNGDPMFTTTLDWIKYIVLDEDGTIHYWHTKDNRDEVHEHAIKWVTEVTLNANDGLFTMNFNYGEPLVVQLDWIKKIYLDDDGTIHYQHAYTPNDETDPNAIKWIDDVTLSQDDGKFIVDFNYGDNYESQLDWVREITMDEHGSLTYDHADSSNTRTDENAVKWLEDLTLNEENGKLVVKYNYGEDYENQLDWVDHIVIAENGDITVHHVSPEIGDELLDAKLKIIESADISEDGTLTFHFNTGEDLVATVEGTEANPFKLRTIIDVTLAEGLTGDHRIGVKYNSDPDINYIGDPVNSIADMVVRDSDFHLLVLYNDPTHRAEAKDLDGQGLDAEGHKWIDQVVGTDGKPTAAGIYWRDYGTIKDQAGVLIARDVKESELGGQDIIDWLNSTYPEGITEGNMKGKMVTHTAIDGASRDFYAFDYNVNEWYYLGSFQDDMRDVKIVETETPSMDEVSDVNVRGLVFKSINYPAEGKEIPHYWDSTYNEW